MQEQGATLQGHFRSAFWEPLQEANLGGHIVGLDHFVVDFTWG